MDVTATSAYCRHAHYLWARAIVDGCASQAYCPSAALTRLQMAKLLVNAFALELYQP